MCAWSVRFWKTVGPSGTDILCAGMHVTGNHCTELLEKTANALNDCVINVMLLAVQKGNLELSIKLAVMRSVLSYRMARKKPHFLYRTCRMIREGEMIGYGERERKKIIGKCVVAFPYMWFYVSVAVC